jgi:U3 small nucleolar RNA-associated protein 7
MDSLFSKADAIRPVSKRRKTAKDDHRTKPSGSKPAATGDDRTLTSVAQHTALPKSLRTDSSPPEGTKKYSHIGNKKLRAQLARQSAQSARAKALVKDAELLLTEDAGMMEVEGDLEKTWRVSQNEVINAAGQEAARGRKEWVLDGGPYRSRYTRNGR